VRARWADDIFAGLAYYASRSTVGLVIRSFRGKEAEKIFQRESSRKIEAVARVAQRKLEMLQCARSLEDLRAFPGNRLEALKGDRAGQHSIRINDQWRVCFIWRNGDAHDVEIVDYH
jgi:proteic killer suppression protein